MGQACFGERIGSLELDALIRELCRGNADFLCPNWHRQLVPRSDCSALPGSAKLPQPANVKYQNG